MPPPDRRDDDDYHFHVYDYEGSQIRGAWGLSDAQPDRDYYPFYSMYRDLRGLQQTGVARTVPNMRYRELGLAASGNRHVLALSFGNLAGAPGAPTVVITGGFHAREWIGPEIAYLVAEYLIMHYKAGPPFDSDYQWQLSRLINSRNIWVIPMVNPDGNYYTVFSPDEGARMWRKNCRDLPVNAAGWIGMLDPTRVNPNQPFTNVKVGWLGWAQYDVPDYDPDNNIPPGLNPHYQTRTLSDKQTGVDLNRNCLTAAWGYDGGPTPTDWNPAGETYFGPKRGSELEAGRVQEGFRTAAANHGLTTTIDYHSYGQYILFPTEASDNGAVGADYKRLGRVLHELIRSDTAEDYKLGTPLQLAGYDATGSIADHSAQQYHARAFTVELDPSTRDPGFELPQTDIRTVFETNIRGALAAIAAPPAGATDEVFYPAVGQFAAWDVYGRGNRLPS